MQVQVIHKAFEDTPVHIATVDVSDLKNLSRMDQLEYAYRWTQNIMDSWSHPSGVQDKNPRVTVEVPVEKYGHRSTSMGDEMVVEGVAYRVAACGFERKEVDFA